MSLGGITDYLRANNISAPEDYSSTPYLPYAQQGPYQAIMSQMGNYGGSAGTGYQQGMGNVYGGGGAGGAMGGFNPDLYKRAAPAAPVVLPDMGGGNRGGGSGGDRSGGQCNGSYGGMPFRYDPNSYTGGLLPALLGQQPPAPIVDTTGYNSVAEAESAQLQSLANQYGMYNNPNAVGDSNYSNEGSDSRSFGRRDAGGDSSYGGDNSGDNKSWGSRDAGGLAKGGQVSMQHLKGPNPMGPDQGYGALKSGEFVINDKAVKKYGIELMNAINSGKISKGKLRGLLEM